MTYDSFAGSGPSATTGTAPAALAASFTSSEKVPNSAAVESFRGKMERALGRAGTQDGVAIETGRAEGKSAFADTAQSFFSSAEKRFAMVQRDAFDLGSGFDISRWESVSLAHERQLRLLSSTLEYQCVIQGAENVKNAVKTLTQLQG
jgi:hypothetical protein